MNYFTQHFAIALLAAATLAVSGCSGAAEKANIEGSVTLDGAPLPQGVIMFQDVAQGIGGSADISDGAFQFSASLPPGQYAVSVQPPPPPAPHEAQNAKTQVKLPRYVQSGDTSQLTADLTAGDNQLQFDLDSKRR
ncbi:MAG: carboxypeptidase-like regulatory domain-containing protein [Blastopirellula sp. JB062]